MSDVRDTAVEDAYQALLDADPPWMHRPSRMDYDYNMFEAGHRAGYTEQAQRIAELAKGERSDRARIQRLRRVVNADGYEYPAAFDALQEGDLDG